MTVKTFCKMTKIIRAKTKKIRPQILSLFFGWANENIPTKNARMKPAVNKIESNSSC